MANYSGHNAADPVASKLDEAERLLSEQQAALRALRNPSPRTQAANVVKSYVPGAERFPQVFRNHSDFFRMVKSLGNNVQGWRDNAMAKAYVEKTAGHIDDDAVGAHGTHAGLVVGHAREPTAGVAAACSGGRRCIFAR